ncbi:cation-translocating P-type ATPase [Sphingobacterium cellulitidis]|uniref:ATPase n=1 Tax=Sphingobacterium cellulitidis TaxID=1768011 RepID=A0A8H9G371_9SPHI|nr:cation-translocating P-type ATPase [Sphingobacterium soli]MBA8986644.1 Ca2+-transporting ATPase [Sphingobacterium soli]GGE27662.1 ATPase [Sphingobacterium soli]
MTENKEPSSNNPYSISLEEFVNQLDSNLSDGLTNEQVESRLNEYGKNKLQQQSRKSIFRIFIDQLNDALIYVLFAAVGITFFMGEYTDGIIILVVILINAFLGLFQEVRANNAIDALRNLSHPKAIVRRGGKVVEVDSELLVPGDLVLLEAGRYVPADLRLIESANLQIEESALTGESVPAEKSAEANLEDEYIPIGDRVNLAFMSTLVTYGRGVGIVFATANQTEVGKIAGLLDSETAEKTPLEIRLDHLGKTLGKLAIGICIIIFIISYFQGRDLTEMFLTSVSLAVASIPEGLAAIVAIVLSIGVTKMAKQNAIVKKLPAVETLGSVTIVCSDKTGTLTQNKMTVQEAFTFSDNLISIDDEGENTYEENLLAEAMVLASDATLEGENQTGDPTEIALLALADQWEMDRGNLQSEQPRVDELAFDSDRKMMSTLHKTGSEYILYTKGAVDNLIPNCKYIIQNEELFPITEDHKKQITDAVEKMSMKALRTLAVAFKKSDSKFEKEDFEKDLVFIGLVGMIDPPRKEVKDSIEKAKAAGVTTIMITGDDGNTAFAIAKELGIAEDISQVTTGKDINSISYEDLESHISEYRVFARVSPEHKVNIVKAFKAKGNIVSMTGDGVNDAPSLNVADIGVAMGITGTDVAKNASDIILADDNFSTIIGAIEQGRNIYNNIKKSVIFLLASNLGEVITMLVAIVAGLPVPLLATQLLWINLITDTLPAVALGMDPGDPNVMNEKPRNVKENFFSNGGGKKIFIAGILIGLLTIAAFLIGYFEHGYNPFKDSIPEDIHEYARTMAFLTIIACQLFYSLSFRHEYKSIFRVGIFSNKYLVFAIILGFALQLMVLFVPILRESFKLQVIGIYDWLKVIGLGLVPLLVNEMIKLFSKKAK